MFISQGYPVRKVLQAAQINASTFYYERKEGKRGKCASEFTLRKDGSWVTNAEVIQDIENLLRQEFVDYGYLKVTHWLQDRKGYLINKKKVYRLMKESKLLNPKLFVMRSPRVWVEELVPKPDSIFKHLEVDIKYLYVHGKRQNVMQVTVIDVLSRWVMGYYLSHSVTNTKVVMLFKRIFSHYKTPATVYVRNDNGSQFIANKVRAFFSNNQVVQEFTKPATPEQNAHIESFHSIVEKLICYRYTFETFAQLWHTMHRFIHFYNTERIHSGVDYQSPLEFIQERMPGFNASVWADCLIDNTLLGTNEGLPIKQDASAWG